VILTALGPAGGWTVPPFGKPLLATSDVIVMKAATAPAISALDATPPKRYCSERSITPCIGRTAR
jgi:hypothetical protein